MIPLFNWKLPANYPGGALAEHLHTKKYCSVSDAGQYGKIRIAGAGCTNALDKILVQSVSASKPGTMHSNLLLAQDGRVVDQLCILHMAEDDFFVKTNPAAGALAEETFRKLLPEEIVIQDLSDVIAGIDLLGPCARDVLLQTEVPEEDIPQTGCCRTIEIAGIRCIASAGSFYGTDGFELFCSNDNIIDLWDELTCIEPVRPCGVLALDSLRIEQGIPGPGGEIKPGANPFECGFTALLRENAQREFSGKAALSTNSPARKMLLAELETRQAARAGCKVMDAENKIIGIVTSGAVVPNLDAACAICLIDADVQTAPDMRLLFSPDGENILSGKIKNMID